MDDVTVLNVVGLPLLVGALGLLVARLCGPRLRSAVAGVTVVLAVIVVHVAVAGWPRLPPRESLDLLPLCVAGAALLAAVRGRPATIALAVVLVVAPAWFLLARLPDMELPTRALWSGSTGVTLLFLCRPILAQPPRSPMGPGVLAVVAGGAAAAGLFSHSLKLAGISGGLGVCLGLVAVWTLLRPCAQITRGAGLAGCIILGVLLVYDQHFLDTPPLELALLVAGWATLQWSAQGPAQVWSVRRQLGHAALAAVPVAAAVVVGFLRYQAEQQSNPYY